MIVLGIETSCDETAVALIREGALLANLVHSQLIHESYGGVVPELASREHDRILSGLVRRALDQAGVEVESLDGIAVTRGPGLAGALLTGVGFAKGMAIGLGKPLIGVHHLEAHIFANFLADPSLDFPFVCLLVSGGHTQLWFVKTLGDYKLLGETRDDAAGEAFDKGARILGLGYPGGPEIERLAQGGNPGAVSFPRALTSPPTLEFSFSGLKTALLYFMDDFTAQANLTLADVAASYQQAILDVLVTKLTQAVRQTGVSRCVVAGGVAANQAFRQQMKTDFPHVQVLFPPLALCTDNAAMVAYLGELYLRRGVTSPLDFPIRPNWPLT
ncbi:MAG: tRNA (adenosine(37)-N6)-threonylcarbamoyltransferase complex transferase subunit TsaD [Fidelibacterota bacterium]